MVRRTTELIDIDINDQTDIRGLFCNGRRFYECVKELGFDKARVCSAQLETDYIGCCPTDELICYSCCCMSWAGAVLLAQMQLICGDCSAMGERLYECVKELGWDLIRLMICRE